MPLKWALSSSLTLHFDSPCVREIFPYHFCVQGLRQCLNRLDPLKYYVWRPFKHIHIVRNGNEVVSRTKVDKVTDNDNRYQVTVELHAGLQCSFKNLGKERLSYRLCLVWCLPVPAGGRESRVTHSLGALGAVTTLTVAKIRPASVIERTARSR